MKSHVYVRVACFLTSVVMIACGERPKLDEGTLHKIDAINSPLLSPLADETLSGPEFRKGTGTKPDSLVLAALDASDQAEIFYLMITQGQPAINSPYPNRLICIANMTSDSELGMSKLRKFPSVKIDEDVQAILAKKIGRYGYKFCDPPNARESELKASVLYLGNIRTDGLGYFYVSRAYICGNLCGDGSTKVISKVNGSWKINGDDLQGWIS